MSIYEKVGADNPEMIESKYQEIQELYPQVGFFLGQQLSNFLTKFLFPLLEESNYFSFPSYIRELRHYSKGF